VAAVLTLGLGAGCASGSDDAQIQIEVNDDASPTEVLAKAAESAATVRSGRMRGTVEYDFQFGDQAGAASMEMEGAFADGGRRSEITADMGAYLRSLVGQMGGRGSDLADLPTSMVMRVVQDGSRMYMKFDVEPAEDGTQYWYLVDYDEMGLDTSAMETPAGLGGGVTSYAETLRGAGADVVETGTETIDGVRVTRFEGTIDPEAAIEQADPESRAELRAMLRESGMSDPVPFRAWVDSDGVLRRMEMTMAVDAGPVKIRVATTIEYYDLGADVTVTEPPADLVRDAAELTGLGA